jgi:hypothetical protein
MSGISGDPPKPKLLTREEMLELERAPRTIPTGVPAIPVSPEEAAKLADYPTFATFSLSQAQAYFNQNGFPHYASTIPLTVASIEFLTNAEVVGRGYSDPGLAPDSLLGVVEVHGQFRGGGFGRIFTSTSLMAFFVAATGNLVMTTGTLPAKKAY